jgi:hypothetical protein
MSGGHRHDHDGDLDGSELDRGESWQLADAESYELSGPLARAVEVLDRSSKHFAALLRWSSKDSRGMLQTQISPCVGVFVGLKATLLVGITAAVGSFAVHLSAQISLVLTVAALWIVERIKEASMKTTVATAIVLAVGTAFLGQIPTIRGQKPASKSKKPLICGSEREGGSSPPCPPES